MKSFVSKVIALCLIPAVALLTAACGAGDSAGVSSADTKPSTGAVTTSTDGVEASAAGEHQTSANAAGEWQEFLEEKMKEYDFSGVVRVSKNGVVLCEGANGLFNYDSGDPITPDNLFPIASVSKQFCAACILLLRDEGKLRLDDTLDKYYPEYARGGDITLKKMLTMRSGIPDYVSNGVGFDAYIRYDFSDAATEDGNHQAVRDWIFAQPLLFEPGSDCSYSDSNYFLLAEIVQTISKKS